MTSKTHTDMDFATVVEQLGGAERLEAEARETRAFLRPREVKTAVDMLQMVLAYCLGSEGLRLTAAWAGATGLAALSNVAVLQRVRNSVPWLEILVARMLVATQPRAPRRMPITGDRPIRLVDGTVLPPLHTEWGRQSFARGRRRVACACCLEPQRRAVLVL